MTKEELQALKEELKVELLEEMKSKRTERVDAAYCFGNDVETWLKEQGYSPSDVYKLKTFIYQGVKSKLRINAISHLSNETLNKAHEIFEYLKPLIKKSA